MTKENFFNAYRELLITNCQWAQDNEKLGKYLLEVAKCLETNKTSQWNPAGITLAQKAWQQIGGKGKLTSTKLQELAD